MIRANEKLLAVSWLLLIVSPFLSYLGLFTGFFGGIGVIAGYPLGLSTMIAEKRAGKMSPRAVIGFLLNAAGLGVLLTMLLQLSMFDTSQKLVWVGTGTFVLAVCAALPLAMLTRRTWLFAAIGASPVVAIALWIASPNALVDVAQSRHPLLVRLILLGRPNLEQRDRGGGTPLIAASDARVISLLLERGADPNAVDNGNQTPLSHAAAVHDLATMQLLVRHGARVDPSAMRTALQVRDARIVHWLRERGAPLVFDGALQIAAEYGDPELMRAVIAAQPTPPTDDDRWNPLMIALHDGNRAIADQLVTPRSCASDVVIAAIAQHPTLAGVCPVR